MNTAIGYKLFRIKKTCPGELFPLYVNADHSIPIGGMDDRYMWTKDK